MAKTTPNRKRRPPPTVARRPPSARPSRRPLALAVLAVVAIVALIAVLATRGGDDDAGDVAAPEATAALTGGDFHSLVADPTTPGRLFAGGREHVGASPDNGRTWSEIEGLRAADAMGWGFTGDAVYVSGHPGLNRSTDAARSSTGPTTGCPGPTSTPSGPARRSSTAPPPGRSPRSTGAPPGRSSTPTPALPSSDGSSSTPTTSSTSWPPTPAPVRSRASTGAAPGHRSTPASPPPGSAAPPTSNSSSPAAPQGAARSTDGGVTWDRLKLPDGASLVELAADGETLIAGVHRPPRVDVHVSRDGGATWQRP